MNANNEISIEITTNEDPCCRGDALIFTQPDVNSLLGRSNTSYKIVRIPKTWILLDSQSKINVFCNGELLTRIHKTNIILRIRCNAGMKTTNMREHVSGYG